MRGTLEGLVSAKQEETMRLQHQLDKTTAAHDRAVREAQESRALWEAEVTRGNQGYVTRGNQGLPGECGRQRYRGNQG